MTSSRKKSNASQDQRQSLVMAGSIVGLCLLLTLTFAVVSVARSRLNESASNNEAPSEIESPYNEEVFKESFLANCTISAKATLSEEAASTYCQCVYDRGIDKYGVKRFIEINQRIVETYDLSELKSLVDECASKTVAP